VTSTAPDFRVVKDVPRLRVAAGATLRLLVVAADDSHCAGIDIDTGALVRAWSPAPPETRVRPYDVVEVTLEEGLDAVPDPAQPEALVLREAPRTVDRLTGRRSERLIRPLLHPHHQPLLGVTASAIPFWQRRADHPSIAVVEPRGRILMIRDGAFLACRFEWQDHERELPCLDRAVAGHMDRSVRTRMTMDKGDRLVVALTAPIDGRCHKVVESVLRRP
jgi:hypothetical protein